MEEPEKNTCPECNTPNIAGAPFCDNCGFRLRRPGTAREGHFHIPREHAKRFKVRDVPDTEPERPQVKVLRDPTMPEGSSTILEGLAAIEHTEAESETVRGHEPFPSTPIPSFSSGIYAIPQEERKSNSFLVAILWIVSLAGAVLLTFYVSSKEESPVTLRQDGMRIEIPAGTFSRGLSEQVRAFMILTCFRLAEDDKDCEEDRLLRGEYPQEEVELAGYDIDSNEVTVRRYDACVEAGVCAPADLKECRVYTRQGYQVSMRVPKSFQEPYMPVTCVTRAEAQAFCEHVAGSLPTHDQWEKAARGERGRLFPWGDAWSPDSANWGEVDIVQTPVLGKIDGHEWVAPTGSFDEGKSPYGIYDMAGNVSEWVAGKGQKGYVRGGSWASLPYELRTTIHMEMAADARRADVGFRCVYPR